MARLMAYSLLTEEDRKVSEGSLDDVTAVAESLLPLEWPGVIVHIEGARLQKWGEPDG